MITIKVKTKYFVGEEIQVFDNDLFNNFMHISFADRNKYAEKVLKRRKIKLRSRYYLTRRNGKILVCNYDDVKR